jgi:hypothetical protein
MMILTLAMILGAANIAPAQDESQQTGNTKQTEQVKDEGKKGDQAGDDELEALRRAADAEAEREEKEEDSKDTVFKSGSLGLQALNPEISVTGDMLANYQSGSDEFVKWDTVFRTLGLHFESYLDPYSRFKAAIELSTVEAEMGEVYFTRYGIPGNFNVTLGKFRQQFGVVNRWHKHALDWFDFPLAMMSIFGEGGLNQIGAHVEWGASTGRVSHEILTEITDGTNPRMFGENAKNRPSILARYHAYQDLTASTYLDVGVTGLFGWNDAWGDGDDAFSESKPVYVYGADLVLMWEPTDKMRYRNIQWRSEAYLSDKEIFAPDGSGFDRIKSWGFYSLLMSKVSRTIELGARYDYFAPDTKDYADETLAPLAVTTDGAYRHLMGGWIRWWQSPFVRFSAGYSYSDGKGTGEDVHLVTFQMVFSAGPHKHERY